MMVMATQASNNLPDKADIIPELPEDMTINKIMVVNLRGRPWEGLRLQLQVEVTMYAQCS